MWSSALVGMQPRSVHTPPSLDSFSMIRTERLSWAARIAATYPPGPEPMIATSYVLVWFINLIASQRASIGGVAYQSSWESGSTRRASLKRLK